MKKSIILFLLLAFVCGTAFADEGEGVQNGGGDGHQFLYIQVGASVMYRQSFGYVFSPYDFFYNFRVGVTGDVLFSFGIFEIGAEIGVYGMEDDYWGFFILECPIDALIRLNFAKDRALALEVRGGAWFFMAAAVYAYTEFGYNGGARLVFNMFYIGGDYIFTPLLGSSWSAEAGIKLSF